MDLAIKAYQVKVNETRLLATLSNTLWRCELTRA